MKTKNSGIFHTELNLVSPPLQLQKLILLIIQMVTAFPLNQFPCIHFHEFAIGLKISLL